MKLKKLLSDSTFDVIKGSLDIEINQIEHHSGRIEKDALFVAISGYQRDGHDFIGQVIESGAVAILVEKDIDLDKVPKGVTIVKVANTTLALAEVANVFYDYPNEKMKVV